MGGKYKRHGTQTSKQHCVLCGREGVVSEGLCRPCRKKERPRDLVVGETYTLDELSEMFGVEITEDSRIVVVD